METRQLSHSSSALPMAPSPLQTPPVSLAPLLSAERGSQALALAITDRQRGLTPAKALQSPQLSTLNRLAPGETAEALSNLLTFAAAQFNVPRNLSDVQVALLVDDLLERYWHWRFDEFVYLCREAIAGRWGCHYATIDAPTVHSWCLAYAEVREAELERAAEQEHKARRLAENAAGPARAANEQAFRRHLETLSDEDLQTGIAFYETHFDEPHAALKSELAAAVLLDRKRLALLKAVVLPDGHAHAEEISEAEYQAFKARWAAAQQVRPAECLCERAQPGEVCPDCHDSGVFDPAAYDAHSQTLLDEMEAASGRKRAATAA